MEGKVIMGDRGEIRLVSKGQPDIYLYTHWGASELAFTLASALERGRGRWGDDSYLNRIIFSEMVKDDVLGETGFGISTEQSGDTRLTITVEHDSREVAYSEYDGYEESRLPFEDFIGKFLRVSA